MHRQIGIGDIAVLNKKVPESLIFQQTKTERPKGVKKNVLVNFYTGGTGFVVSKSKICIGTLEKKLAIILTAGHVVCSIGNFKPLYKQFGCSLEDGGSGVAYFIKSFIKDQVNELKSFFTDAYYCC